VSDDIGYALALGKYQNRQITVFVVEGEMQMFECPNCNKKTISKSSKFWIGPIRSITCTNCNAKVSVPYLSLFLLTLYLALMLIIPKLKMNLIAILTMIVLIFVTYIYLNYKFVSLEVKLRKNEDGYKKKKIKNTIIAICYLALSFTIIFSLT